MQKGEKIIRQPATCNHQRFCLYRVSILLFLFFLFNPPFPATAQTMVLTVSDNGIGLPPGLDFRQTESLGLQLVITLTEQLSGSIR